MQPINHIPRLSAHLSGDGRIARPFEKIGPDEPGYEDREIRLQVWSAEDHVPLGKPVITDHDRLMALLSDHLDGLNARGLRNSAEYDVTRAAYYHLESDQSTGTSLACWEPMARLVDRAVTDAVSVDDPGTYVTTEWAQT